MEIKYIAIIACAFLLLFLLYMEIKRKNKARLIWRIMANIIAITCFVLLLIPIEYKTYLKQNANELILLTKGTNQDSIAKIKGQKYALASAEINNTNTTLIPDLSYFLKANPTVKKLSIYGYGLNNDELNALKRYQITFHPTEKPTGIIAINWQRKLKTTEKLMVQGIYQNLGNKTVKLLLKGLGNSIDSMSVLPHINQSFSFQNQPKHIGKAIYQLVALIDKDTLSNNPVPFQVEDQLPMRVLILASFPDFEYKFLKKWLFENQYPVAFRSQISKNKYSTDFLNLDSLNLNRINALSLKKFDVLIIDEEELAAINPEERSSIDYAVSAGMGLIIRISSVKSTTSLGQKFSRFETLEPKDKQLRLELATDQRRLEKLPMEQKLFLKSNQADQPIITDASGKILVNSTIKGNGKLLASTISATYNWFLLGREIDYSLYWSELLSKASKKKNETNSTQLSPQFPNRNQKLRIISDFSESDQLPRIKIDSIILAPRQNMELPFQWDAVYWPKKDGWNNLQVNQTNNSFYVFNKNDWESLKDQQTLELTEEFAKNSSNYETKKSSTDIIIVNLISLWWFFIGFLFSSAFLWYESRVLSSK